MGQKKWYTSRTLWTNFIAILSVFGLEITAEEAVLLLAAANIILRLITKKELIP